jgi:hypothetical protein
MHDVSFPFLFQVVGRSRVFERRAMGHDGEWRMNHGSWNKAGPGRKEGRWMDHGWSGNGISVSEWREREVMDGHGLIGGGDNIS